MKKILLILSGAGIFLSMSAQPRLVQPNFLAGGIGDAQKLLTAYVSPWANMFGASLSGGWYNTAKPHKLGGFDLTVTTNIAVTPKADRAFDVSTLGLQNLQAHAGESTTSQTIAGKWKDGPSMDILDNSGNILKENAFTMPKGSLMSFTILPMAQVGIGFIKGTEFMARYCPPLAIGKSGTLDLWGVGMKHSLMQYLPGEKLIPLDVSLMAGYTQFRSRAGINYKPDYFTYDPALEDLFNDQKMEMKFKVLTANLLISTTLPIVNVYGGVGYMWNNANFKMTGHYPMPDMTFVDPLNVNSVNDDVKVDPVDMEIKSKSGLRYTLGFRLKFGVLTLHADYTYAYYSMVTTGLGISFR